MPYTFLINAVTGYRMSDAMCGFKAFRVSSIRRVTEVISAIRGKQYTAAELYLRFSRAGLRLGEIPIRISKRASGESHKGTFRFGFSVLKVILRTSLSFTRRIK